MHTARTSGKTNDTPGNVTRAACKWSSGRTVSVGPNRVLFVLQFPPFDEESGWNNGVTE